MLPIEGILFEPVGCLAEFPAEPFNEIAARLFGRKRKPSRSGSRSYWHLLNLIEAALGKLGDSETQLIEALESDAVGGAGVYEDVLPALAELKAMDTQILLASSLSNQAVTRFLGKSSASEFFSAVWSRDSARGVKDTPLRCAMDGACLSPQKVMFLTDTAEGLKAAKQAGAHPVLMMNDPDEARRLALQDPAGGVVSLHELPDFLRLIRAENAKPLR